MTTNVIFAILSALIGGILLIDYIRCGDYIKHFVLYGMFVLFLLAWLPFILLII